MFHRGRCNVFTVISPGGTDGLPCPAQDLVLQPHSSRPVGQPQRAGRARGGLQVARGSGCPQRSRPHSRPPADPGPAAGRCRTLDSGRAGGFGHAKGPFFSPLLALVTQPVALLHTIAGDKILLECG